MRRSTQTDQDAGPNFAADQEQRPHYCRGCGQELPLRCRRHFHKECLRTDKRRRICEQRQREQERFKRLLEKQRCATCGAKYGDKRSDGILENVCEASQAIQERDFPMGEGRCQKPSPERSVALEMGNQSRQLPVGDDMGEI
jgi:hypothetical protein